MDSSARSVNGSWPIIRYVPPSIPAIHSDEASGTTLAASPAPPAEQSVLLTPLAQVTLIASKGEAIYAATDYWIEGGRLFYVLGSGAEGAFDLREVDWDRTAQLNAERGITVTVRVRPRLR